LLLISEVEVLDDVSKAALELKKNLPNSRILTWQPGVDINDALIGRARMFYDNSKKLINIVANARTQIDIVVEVGSDAALMKVRRINGTCTISEASMLTRSTTRN